MSLLAIKRVKIHNGVVGVAAPESPAIPVCGDLVLGRGRCGIDRSKRYVSRTHVTISTSKTNGQADVSVHGRNGVHITRNGKHDSVLHPKGSNVTLFLMDVITLDETPQIHFQLVRTQSQTAAPPSPVSPNNRKRKSTGASSHSKTLSTTAADTSVNGASKRLKGRSSDEKKPSCPPTQELQGAPVNGVHPRSKPQVNGVRKQPSGLTQKCSNSTGMMRAASSVISLDEFMDHNEESEQVSKRQKKKKNKPTGDSPDSDHVKVKTHVLTYPHVRIQIIGLSSDNEDDEMVSESDGDDSADDEEDGDCEVVDLSKRKPPVLWQLGTSGAHHPVTCICQAPERELMVECDRQECPIRRWHLRCAGMETPPTGPWVCSVCRLTSSDYTSRNYTHMLTTGYFKSLPSAYLQDDFHRVCQWNEEHAAKFARLRDKMVPKFVPQRGTPPICVALQNIETNKFSCKKNEELKILSRTDPDAWSVQRMDGSASGTVRASQVVPVLEEAMFKADQHITAAESSSRSWSIPVVKGQRVLIIKKSSYREDGVLPESKKRGWFARGFTKPWFDDSASVEDLLSTNKDLDPFNGKKFGWCGSASPSTSTAPYMGPFFDHWTNGAYGLHLLAEGRAIPVGKLIKEVLYNSHHQWFDGLSAYVLEYLGSAATEHSQMQLYINLDTLEQLYSSGNFLIPPGKHDRRTNIHTPFFKEHQAHGLSFPTGAALSKYTNPRPPRGVTPEMAAMVDKRLQKV